MKSMVARVSAIVVVAALGGSLAAAQNLVVNGGFESDVGSWVALSDSSLAWDPLDADDDPNSGSALVTNLDPDPVDGTGAVQCIDGLSGEQSYAFSAKARFPSGQTETGRAYLLIQWRSSPGCTGDVGISESSLVSSSVPDIWLTTSNVVVSPTATQSARLRLSVLKNAAGGSLDAYFDHVRLEPAVFGDGFESGDVTAWSSSVPE